VWGQHADEKSSQIAYEILGYLAEHPDAQDTLDGIVEWWLLEQKIAQQKAFVEKALDELVAKGFVLKRTGKDRRPHYRMDRRRHGEIKALLKEMPR
jgi:hypothetical protein